uniref:Osteoclast-stimulating factor 1 n=2 Tax=Nothobranchius rachovii TaxID=451742 RepID=A0A1A8PDN4_9TELE
MEVLVEFDYDALHDDELTLRPGDVIKNVRCLVDEDGWMEGELNGKRGVFPDNFVKEVKKETKTEPHPTAAPSKRKSGNVANLVNRMSTILPTGGFQPVPPAASNKPKKRRCKVLFDYQPFNEDELELKVGDFVDVVEEVEEGWWSGSLKGKSGLFPSNFVEELEIAGEEAEPNSPSVNVTDGSPPKVVTTPTSPSPASGNSAICQPTKVPRIGFGDIFKNQSFQLKSTQKEEKDQQASSSSSAAKPAHPHMADPQKEEGDGKHKDTSVLVSSAKDYCKVTFAYEAKNEDELSLKEGDIVHILDKDTGESGWWRGEVGGHQGFFPNNFVVLVPEAEKETPPSRGSLKSSQKSDSMQKQSKPPPPSKPPAPKPDVPSVDKKPHSVKLQDKDDKTTTDGKPLKPLPPSVPRKKPVPVPPKKPEKPLTSSSSFKQNGELPSSRPKPDTEPVLPVVPKVEPVDKPADSDLKLFDELSLTSDKLPHPTAGRPKFHGRRLPAHFSGTQSPSRDVNFEKALKDDKEDGGITKPTGAKRPSINSSSPTLVRPTNTKPTPTVASSVDGDVLVSSKAQLESSETSSQLDELRSQIKELLLSVELLKTQQTKEISDLRGELEEERLKRVTLQMEVEDLKRTIHLT